MGFEIQKCDNRLHYVSLQREFAMQTFLLLTSQEYYAARQGSLYGFTIDQRSENRNKEEKIEKGNIYSIILLGFIFI